jgi:hypothetical protein
MSTPSYWTGMILIFGDEMPNSEIRELEEQIGELMVKLNQLQKDNKGD